MRLPGRVGARCEPIALFQVMILAGACSSGFRSCGTFQPIGGAAAAIIAEVEPNDILEWIWVRDIVDFEREILRYRKAKAELLDTAVAHAADKEAFPHYGSILC